MYLSKLRANVAVPSQIRNFGAECAQQDFRRQHPRHAVQYLHPSRLAHPVREFSVVEAVEDAPVESATTAGAILKDNFGKLLAQMIEHGVEIFNVTPSRILNEAVAHLISVFFYRHVVVDPKNIEIIFLDDPGNLRFHPFGDHGIAHVEVASIGDGVTVTSQNPVRMFFA